MRKLLVLGLFAASAWGQTRITQQSVNQYQKQATSPGTPAANTAYLYFDGINIVCFTSTGASCLSGGGGGSGTVTNLATTSPITGGTITTTGTIGCATCVTSAGSLTSTALVTGAGSQGSQTPSATSTLDASGNLTIPGILTSGAGGTGTWTATEGTAATGVAASDVIYADSTAHRFKVKNNNGTADTLATFTDALSVFGAGALASGTTATTQSASDNSTKVATTAYADRVATTGNINATVANYVAGGGTAQAQTATFSPALSALTTGATGRFLPTAANTAAAPTFAPNGLTAKNVTKCGTVALVANDFTTTQPAEVSYDGTEWVLQNPQAIPCGLAQGSGTAYISTFTGGVQTNSGQPATNATKLWTIVPSVSVVSSAHLAVFINTADATGADLYNLALFNTAGNIVCQTGAQSSTTLGFTTTGAKFLSWTGACGPILANQRYYFGYTAVTTTIVLGGMTQTPQPVSGVVPSSNNTTASAVWTTPIGIPADSWALSALPAIAIY